MYRLLLIRHAKSSWSQPQLQDHQRPLNQRGQRDVSRMAQWLKQQQPELDAIYTSTAVRAHALAMAIAGRLDVPIFSDSELYTFSADQLLQHIQSLPDHYNCVAVVGHNPAITELLNALCGDVTSNLPTAAIASLHCDVSRWQNLADNTCQLEDLTCPKDLSG